MSPSSSSTLTLLSTSHQGLLMFLLHWVKNSIPMFSAQILAALAFRKKIILHYQMLFIYCVCACHRACVVGDQMATFESCLTHSTMRIQGIKRRLSDLVTSTLIYRAISSVSDSAFLVHPPPQCHTILPIEQIFLCATLT